MEGVDSDDNDQEVIIIPIKDKTRDPSPAEIGFRTENGVTVINIDKSNNERSIYLKIFEWKLTEYTFMLYARKISILLTLFG